MHNQPLQSQVKSLESILGKSDVVQSVLDGAQQLDAPNWYLGAGCISQTVWNYLHGYDIESNIKDFDLVYCDASDLSYEAEDAIIKRAKEIFGDLNVEVRTQARVHLWLEKKFGQKTKPYLTTEEGINDWPTTATCVAVRKAEAELLVYAPYGLNDLFGMVLRPNKAVIQKERYEHKAAKWTKLWPQLKVMGWDE